MEASSKKIALRKPPITHKKWKFSLEEDAILRQLVSEFGTSRWKDIAERLPGRNERQCRDRWEMYLSPDLKKPPWTKDEDELLFCVYKEIGPHWVKIAKMFKGRTDTAIKNRWNLLQRKESKIINHGEEFRYQYRDVTNNKPSIKICSETLKAPNSFGIDEDFAATILLDNGYHLLETIW